MNQKKSKNIVEQIKKLLRENDAYIDVEIFSINGGMVRDASLVWTWLYNVKMVTVHTMNLN